MAYAPPRLGTCSGRAEIKKAIFLIKSVLSKIRARDGELGRAPHGTSFGKTDRVSHELNINSALPLENYSLLLLEIALWCCKSYVSIEAHNGLAQHEDEAFRGEVP